MRNTNFFEYHGSNWDTKKVKDVAAVNEENISSSDIYDEIEYIEISTVNKGEISDIPIINFDDAPSRVHIPVMSHTESGVCRTVKRGKTLA